MKFRGKHDGTKFTWIGSRAWIAMKLNGLRAGDYDIEIKLHRAKPTQKQRGYYFRVVVALVYQGMQDAGYGDEIETEEDAHEFLKLKFFRRAFYSEAIDALEETATTKNWPPKEFADRCEQIRKWAWDFLNINIPPPDSDAASLL